jgi:hypothetical protein
MQALISLIDLTFAAMLQHDSQCGGGGGNNSVCNDGDGHDNCNNNQSLHWVPEKRPVTQ